VNWAGKKLFASYPEAIEISLLILSGVKTLE